MRMTKKVLGLILAMVMVLGLLPATALATDAEYVYISVSYEGQYVQDKNGAPIAHVPVSMETLAAVNLDDYGLSEYWYDENGDGSNEITALHLVIYAHENLYGGSWSDVSFTGGAGSSYFQGGVFGFDENLNYYLNGQYPLAGEGWGATSDQIVLEAGDCLDMASYTCWGFYSDPAFGFHYFADDNGDITHAYTAEAGAECTVNLIKGTKAADYSSQFKVEPDYTVSYGTTPFSPDGTVTTGSDGSASVTFEEAGTYYLWCDGGHGTEGVNENGAGYHDYCDYYTSNGEPCIISSPAYAVVTVTAQEAPAPEEPPREAQDVSTVLDATMAKLAATVTEPAFGTSAGEWTVLSLARGGYYAKDNAYFTDYYARIVETVNETAATVDMNGALHKNKSTENSRLIVALAALGKDATSVGDYNLITPFENFTWIVKQGVNGPTWALIALDSNDYQTEDTTIRQQCIDLILQRQHNDGGWAGSLDLTYASDPDYTGMALQALYPYREQEAVAAACEKAFDCLSQMQLETGGFASDGAETAESAAQVIVACTTWGINPDTDSRFIKNGKSVVDALLAHYLEDSAQFQHAIGSGANDMATDQACYALVAYDRLMNDQTALYDFSDVTFDPVVTPESDEMTATLGLPSEINAADAFNGVISINKWDNEAGYKLIDFIVTVPEGVNVTGVTAGERLGGGQISYHLEAETGKLRVVYFDANENTDLSVSGEEFPAELFTIGFAAGNVSAGTKLDIAVSGMSVKLSSDSSNEEAMIIVNSSTAMGSVDVVEGISFSAVCLYEGDDVDLIPSTKKAVAVAVTGITGGTKLTYNDGTNEIEFKYSAEISEKSGVSTDVALVDAAIETERFVNESYFTIPGGDAATVTFGDSNGDGVINAQDALAVVDTWLRKGDQPTDDEILVLNVNGDSRINTFDALGIVEKFINGSEYGVITKAVTITTKQ